MDYKRHLFTEIVPVSEQSPPLNYDWNLINRQTMRPNNRLDKQVVVLALGNCTLGENNNIYGDDCGALVANEKIVIAY